MKDKIIEILNNWADAADDQAYRLPVRVFEQIADEILGLFKHEEVNMEEYDPTKWTGIKKAHFYSSWSLEEEK